MSVLFINACVRENSRTLILATEYLKNIKNEVTQVNLEQLNLQPLNRERLALRDSLVANQSFGDEFFNLARQFASAEEIVLAAPFWDLSFPATVKTYFENVSVSGITFRYDNGRPVGLCTAKRLVYFTTAGGKVFEDFGYSYVKSLATNFYGIKDTVCYRVENLDVNCIEGEGVLSQPVITVK